MRVELKDAARGRWQGILPLLGVPPQVLTGKHAPCPVCGGRDRFRFDDKEGLGTFLCSGCGEVGRPAAGDGIKLVMMLKKVDFKGARELIEPLIEQAPVMPIRTDRPQTDKIKMMKRLWASSFPVSASDPVGRYLHGRLGEIDFPKVLRSVSELPYRHDDGRVTYHPAMLAKVTSLEGEGVNIHRTYLTMDGQKITFGEPRKMMPGYLPDGAAVRLGPVSETLGVAEGIETALAAHKLFNVTCWSTINASMLIKWLPPEGVKRVIIFGDNDENYVGQEAAFALAKKLAIKKLCETEVRLTERVGEDWNDILLLAQNISRL